MLLDRHERPLGTLRLSITDRCNLRCHYCMPEDEYVWLPQPSILSALEIERVVRAFAAHGASEVRLTGGEPLLRRDAVEIVERVRRVSGISEVTLTTNGLLFERHATDLRRAGLSRVTFSLDTLQKDRALKLTRSTRLHDTIAAIEGAAAHGFEHTKVNSVIVRGENDDEIVDLLRFAERAGVELRFLEYMDVGGATQWHPDRVVGKREIIERIAAAFGPVKPYGALSAAPASRFVTESGAVFGVVASTTEPFCARCDRARVTADGVLFTCLYAASGVDLAGPLRRGEDDAGVAALIASVWTGRADRGAEDRVRISAREDVLIPAAQLKRDPHREMHTRGG
ncbi:GTP 3',8-cyclase MoaA [soil metagenome]